MAFTVSGLGSWTNENNQTLISQIVLEPTTTKFATVLEGIKYKEQIKFLSSEVEDYIQAYACGTPTTSGTTTLTDKDITVVDLMYFETFCPEDLNTTSMQLSNKPGMNEDFGWEAQLVDLKSKQIAEANDKLIWSTTTSSTKKPAGFIYLFNNDASVKDSTFTWSATGKTQDDYLTEIYYMLSLLPEKVRDDQDLKLIVSQSISMRMTQSFVKAGDYHINFTDKNGISTWQVPGAEHITVVPTVGLTLQNVAVLTPGWNLIIGTDLKNGWEKAKFYWNEAAERAELKFKYRLGTQYYYSSYVVLSQ